MRSAPARKARRRHFRPSGADHAGQPDRDHGDARQQCRRRTSPKTPARSRSTASRTACCRISLRSRAATGSASARAISTFIPTKPWLFLSVERQSELHVYKLNADGTLPLDASFIKNALADRANAGHTQMAGAIHVHPNGRFVYMTNRNSGTEEIGGRKVFKGGENNVAVFSIDPATGEPTLIQNIDGADQPSAHLRHRSERTAFDRGQHPADGDARRLDAAGRPRALSHRRRRHGSNSRARSTSTPAASCSSGPASSRCRSTRRDCRIRWRR